jgi:TldD protein
MAEMSRRSFLKTTAGAAALGATVPLLSAGWPQLLAAEAPGYFEREFGISDALCQRVLAQALAKGGDFADLFFEHTISNWIILEDGRVNRAFSDVALGVGIRTVKGDQVGYGFTQELTEKAMRAAAAVAATIANGAPARPAAAYAWLKTQNHYPLKRLPAEVALNEKLPLVQQVNEKCFALSPQVVKVNASFHDQQKRIMVLTSDGVKAEDLQPRSYLSANVVAEKNGRREQAGADLGGRRDFSFYDRQVIDDVARKAVADALLLFDAVQPPAGEMAVVFAPGITAILLHEAIGHGMEADFNRKQTSTYCTMIGKKVAEPFITIVDDGTIAGLPGSVNFDDEGTPGQRTVLVENGVLKSYMHDKISARHYKVRPTGNGRRESYQHFVQPRMRNTVMLAGTAASEDIIRGARKGIFVQKVSNGQVNIGEGDFAFYVSQGKLIEDGKLTATIKDVNIMGNGPRMLQNITMLGSDLELHPGGGGTCGKGGQGVPVGFGQPSCLVKSLTVGGVKS